jgi:hypothetical protein
MGYLLVAFQVGGPMGASAAAFYLVAYFVMTLGAFGVVTTLSERGRDADLIDDYRGLFWRRPALALVFTAMLLSLAGIPLTAGFLGKFYIVVSAAGRQRSGSRTDPTAGAGCNAASGRSHGDPCLAGNLPDAVAEDDSGRNRKPGVRRCATRAHPENLWLPPAYQLRPSCRQ